ncbi:MAG: DUF3047 domain-containing protein [Candidatus Omnitrophica bacterium]|nr:DUF3047 domain-containing protein [Candidatus Omnitrophota bacterium]
MSRLIIYTLLVSIALIACTVSFGDALYLKHFSFNSRDDLGKWSEMVLDGKVDYFIDLKGDNGFVHADSKKACSVIFYKIGFKPKQYPILRWRWCILKFPKKAYFKGGETVDDYAARVYIIYPGFTFPSFRFIEYIWSEHLPEGHMQQSPSAKNIMQIVVRSGRDEAGKWVQEERNIYEDFEKAFGEKTSRSAGAVAIMCNSNLTGSEAEALVDNITIGKESGVQLEVAKDEK